ncbi:MAG: methionyl-tRNA formyltransferase [Chloroflexi bacterium RBG_13_57_8]|nr:MAG: methionyl-tRNA formyltransferase [Chloroflexi bacterium RBG_13_57_8]
MLEFFSLEVTLRIVFMGSPASSVPSLEALVFNHYQVVAVYTRPDKPAGRGRVLAVPPLKEAAVRLGLPVVQTPGFMSPGALEELRDWNPDVIIICAFGQILPQAVLDVPPLQCLNIHFSLLPRHRGASPVAAAILAGDEFTGVSVQLVRKKLDTGPVLASAAVPVFPADNTGTLTDKLAVVGAHLVQEALVGWRQGEITPIAQDETCASYFPQIKKEDGEIDWHLPAATIWRRTLAFSPWPGCYTNWRGKTLKIIEAMPLENMSANPGEVVALGGGETGGMGVGTGEGVLEILQIQLAGRKVMAAAEFLRGQRDLVGSVFPDRSKYAKE